jgi:hypothetical protein
MKTTYHGKFALPSSARVPRASTGEPISSGFAATAWRRAAQRLAGILVLVAVLFNTSVAAAQGGRPDMKRPIASNASVQRISPERITSGQKGRMDAVNSPTSFRAEDIVPDICKGCRP